MGIKHLHERTLPLVCIDMQSTFKEETPVFNSKNFIVKKGVSPSVIQGWKN